MILILILDVDNASKDDEKEFEYHMSSNDLYLHTIAHMYKHYILGGFGIRFFADVYVLLTKLKDELDKAYIDSKLEKMGLVDFEFDVEVFCLHFLMIKKSQTRRFCFLMNLFHSPYMAVGELPAPNFIMMNIGQSTVMFAVF